MEQQHEPLWGDSEIANVASLMPTKREAAIMVEILRKRRDQYEAKLSALRAQAQPLPQEVHKTLEAALKERKYLANKHDWFYTKAEQQQLIGEVDNALSWLAQQPTA